MDIPNKTDPTLEEVKKELLQLPNIIRSLRGTLLDQERKHIEATSIRKSTEAKIAREVQNAEKDGKKTFSNKELRELETQKRCNESEELKQQSESERKFKHDVDESRHDLEYVQNRFKGIRRITPLFYGAELSDEDTTE